MESEEGRASATGPEITADEAAKAMSAIDGSRSWLASRMIAPGWYHLAFGLLAGGAIAEGEARSWLLFGWSVAAYTIGCGALSWWNQRRVGTAMQYFDRRTTAVFTANALALSMLIAAACWLDLGDGVRGAFLAAGVLAVPLTVAFGRWADMLLRARLQVAV